MIQYGVNAGYLKYRYEVALNPNLIGQIINDNFKLEEIERSLQMRKKMDEAKNFELYCMVSKFI